MAVTSEFCKELVEIYASSNVDIRDKWLYVLGLYFYKHGYYDANFNKIREIPQELMNRLYNVAKYLDSKNVKNLKKAESLCEKLVMQDARGSLTAEAQESEKGAK